MGLRSSLRVFVALALLMSLIGFPIQGIGMDGAMSSFGVADSAVSDKCGGCGDDFSIDGQCPDVFCTGFYGIRSNSIAQDVTPFGAHKIGRNFVLDGQLLIPEPFPPRT